MSRAGTTTVILLVLLGSLAGCSTRSISAFCSELDDGMEALYARGALAESQENPFAGLAMLVGSFGEFQLMLDRLADVAPSEIRADVEVTREVVSRQLDVGAATSDPLSALIGSFGDGLVHQSSFDRVDRFARQHCGQPVFGP